MPVKELSPGRECSESRIIGTIKLITPGSDVPPQDLLRAMEIDNNNTATSNANIPSKLRIHASPCSSRDSPLASPIGKLGSTSPPLNNTSTTSINNSNASTSVSTSEISPAVTKATHGGNDESTGKSFKDARTKSETPDGNISTWEKAGLQDFTSEDEKPVLPRQVGMRLSCLFCKFSTDFPSHLQVHSRVHTGERPYSCPVCKKTFTQSNAVTVHMRIHTKSKPFKCSFCQKSFRTSSHLSDHKRIHTKERPFICILCRKTFRISSTLRQHLRIHTNERPYSCKICDKKFIQSSQLKSHTRVHGCPEEDKYPCPICNRRFLFLWNLNYHVKVTHGTGEKPFQCNDCPKSFALKQYMARHHRYAHGDQKQATPCDECGKLLSSKSNLRKHVQLNHQPPRFTCPLCNKGFFQQAKLVIHTRMHTGEKPFFCTTCNRGFAAERRLINHQISRHSVNPRDRPHVCLVCGKRYLTRSTLKAHMKEVHDPESPKSLMCDNCGKTFRHNRNLQNHRKIHNVKSYHSCMMCSKSFAQMGNLKVHINTVHLKTKRFPCPVCSFSFATRRNQESHMRVHTGDKPYPCSDCPKKFSQHGTLIRHQRIHSGEKPFPCTVCSKSFSQKTHLVGHMRSHTGHKPFVCSVCDTSFALSSTLQSHMRTHTGLTPYQCDRCDKTFTQKTPLVRHVERGICLKLAKCKICKIRMPKAQLLKSHYKEHKACAEQENASQAKAKQIKGGPKPSSGKRTVGKDKKRKGTSLLLHQCDHCDKTFTRKSPLVKHLERKTCLRPAKCKICKISMPKAVLLKNHYKEHEDHAEEVNANPAEVEQNDAGNKTPSTKKTLRNRQGRNGTRLLLHPSRQGYSVRSKSKSGNILRCDKGPLRQALPVQTIGEEEAQTNEIDGTQGNVAKEEDATDIPKSVGSEHEPTLTVINNLNAAGGAAEESQVVHPEVHIPKEQASREVFVCEKKSPRRRKANKRSVTTRRKKRDLPSLLLDVEPKIEDIKPDVADMSVNETATIAKNQATKNQAKKRQLKSNKNHSAYHADIPAEVATHNQSSKRGAKSTKRRLLDTNPDDVSYVFAKSCSERTRSKMGRSDSVAEGGDTSVKSDDLQRSLLVVETAQERKGSNKKLSRMEKSTRRTSSLSRSPTEEQLSKVVVENVYVPSQGNERNRLSSYCAVKDVEEQIYPRKKRNWGNAKTDADNKVHSHVKRNSPEPLATQGPEHVSPIISKATKPNVSGQLGGYEMTKSERKDMKILRSRKKVKQAGPHFNIGNMDNSPECNTPPLASEPGVVEAIQTRHPIQQPLDLRITKKILSQQEQSCKDGQALENNPLSSSPSKYHELKTGGSMSTSCHQTELPWKEDDDVCALSRKVGQSTEKKLKSSAKTGGRSSGNVEHRQQSCRNSLTSCPPITSLTANNGMSCSGDDLIIECSQCESDEKHTELTPDTPRADPLKKGVVCSKSYARRKSKPALPQQNEMNNNENTGRACQPSQLQSDDSNAKFIVVAMVHFP